MRLSILTATYNRGKYLRRIYESIVNQVKNNIEAEWIIIDDGSTDNTKEIVEKLRKNNENEFVIKYIYQENQGKMAAINNGIKGVTGDLIVDCDSDDYFAKNAFEIIEDNASYLLESDKIYALCFLKQDIKGNVSGNRFRNNYEKSTMFDLYFKEEVKGEKILVFNSKIRKKYKHELEGKEKFITESRMYHKMDNKYKVICINEVIEIGDYLDEGYTKNINYIFINNSKGYYKYFKEILRKNLKGIRLRKKLYIMKHFICFGILNIIKKKKDRVKNKIKITNV